MLAIMPHTFRAAVLVLAVLASSAPAHAETAQEKYYRAYYLEESGRDYAAAAKLYDEIAADRGAPADLAKQARTRLAGCREELACADLARLMPPGALVYAEVNSPGEHVKRLLAELGLLADAERAVQTEGRRLAVSPALVSGLLGIRGVAVAITGFDVKNETPSGVAVLHPGEIDAVRGLIETALPAAAEPAPPIHGCAAYRIKTGPRDPEVLVALSARLVIVSNSPSEIEGVLTRLEDASEPSLATNEDVLDVLKDRSDALLFFCVNAKPVMPLLQVGIGAAGSQSREIAIAGQLLDLKSLRALSGRIGMAADGLHVELSLRLDKGHRNLAFNLLRTPAIDEATLRCVPEGAAAFFAGALNDASTPGVAPLPATGENAAPIVSLLDVGREIFANINGYAAFVLPPASKFSPGRGIPMPDAALVMSVKDSARSKALWAEALGIGSVASGHGTLDGQSIEIDGAAVQEFSLPEGISIYLAAERNRVILSPSRTAIGRALGALRGGKSVYDDASLSRSLARLDRNATIAAIAHAGRCVELATAFAGEPDRELQPILPLLKDTVGAFVLHHGNEELRLSATITGLPQLGGLVASMLNREFAEHGGMRVGYEERRISPHELHIEVAPRPVELPRTGVPSDGGQ